MTPEELLDEWESGESNGLRPKRIQVLRDDIEEFTGMSVPRRVSQIEGWAKALQSQITRKLRMAAGEYESDE
jgi:hypothetical protein